MIRERTGLSAADHVLLGIRRAMARSGVTDPTSYMRILTTNPDAFPELVTEMTVGETYFLREREQFDFMINDVLPRLRSTKRPGDDLRAWSAACATGEEAYSLAIAGQIGNALPVLRVLGTDIAESRLAHARQAVYGEWSLRGVPDDTIRRYFRRTNRRVTVVPEIRSVVDFRELNLASADWLSAGIRPSSIDLILCRNVLIYLDPATIAHIATHLIRSLREGGWLFLGASDPSLKELVECEVVITGAGVAYRRRSAVTRRTVAPATEFSHHDPSVRRPTHWQPPPLDLHSGALSMGAPRPIAPPPLPLHEPAAADAELAEPLVDVATRAYAEASYLRAADAARATVTLDPRQPTGWIVLVRSLANMGRHEDAELACASGLDVNRTSAELTYMQAILLRQVGKHTEALHSFRCAVYLDRNFIVAHLGMGDVLSVLGDRESAQRSFRNAERLLLATTPDSASIPGADGLDAPRLLAHAQTQLRLLDQERAQ